MKANEFVKLRGISYCKNLLIKADGCAAIQAREDNSRVSVDDLKRLVESHELVESKGGLIKAKEILADNPVWCSGSKRYSSPLERAIADVESCMEVSSESN
ncbi:hypothetical protein [Acinetobacter lwoffii]|uniref:hypothetical protein n=1 Tax=Acinetobacter lwoffii TaxID=28090 RepID=UPI00168CCFE5|nr:hypothetical protein [Acinetobacter lwoffii]